MYQLDKKNIEMMFRQFLAGDLDEFIGPAVNHEFGKGNLTGAVQKLGRNQFEVLNSTEELRIQQFYDIGALVYYLNAIPWQVETGFNMKSIKRVCMKYIKHFSLKAFLM